MAKTAETRIGRGNAGRLGLYLAALAAAFCTAVLFAQEPAHAGESFTWTGEGNGSSWTDPCNWYEEGACQEKYPGKENPDDTATIEGLGSGPAAVTLGEDITLDSLNLGRGPTGSSVTGGSLTLNRGLGWTGGFLKTGVNLTANGVGTVSGSDYKQLDGAFNNGGRLILDSGILNMQNTARINNTGTFSIAKGSKVYGLVCCPGPQINSTGTIEVGSFLPIPGADTATIDSVSFNADNIIDVGGGTLEVRWAPGKIDAGTVFMGDGTFRVTNKADMAMNGAFSLEEETRFELDSCSGACNRGSLSGKGAMNGNGLFMWKGGDVDGELTLGQQIDTYVDGPAPKYLDGKISNIGRTVLMPGVPNAPTNQMRFGAGSVFTNPGTFIAEERTEMVGTGGCCLPPTANFFNTGTFMAAGPSGTTAPNVTTVKSMGFRAGGTVNVESGVLDLTDGAGTIPAGAKITGGGTVQLTEGQTMTMAGAFGVDPSAKLQIGNCLASDCTAGQLDGVGTLGGGGTLRWVSGSVGTGRSDANDDLTVAAGSRMTLSGSSYKYLRGNLTNRGTAYFLSPAAPAPATGPLSFGSNGRFVNSATFNLGDRAVLLSGVGCCGGTADLVNLGRLTMTKAYVPSAGSVTLDSLLFENRGTVDLSSGTLRLGRLGGYNQFSGSTRLTGGKVESAGQVVKLMGGSLVGAGTITANVQNLNSTVAPGAPGTAGSTGTIRISGNYVHSGRDAILKADLKGTTPGTGFDQLQVTGEALVNWGVLDLDRAAGFAPGTSTRLRVLTAGKVSGSGFSRLQDAGLPNGRSWYEIDNPRDITLGVRQG